jgi:mono/diheme cytochrome c family protein
VNSGRSLAAVLVLSACAGPALAADPPLYPDGQATFKANCAVCHGMNGAGLPSLAPPLTHYPARYAEVAEGRRQLAMTVLFGMFGDVLVDGQHYNFKMPDFSRLGDAALAGALNFVVFDLGAAVPLPADAQRAPLAAAEIAAEREPRKDGEQVRAHRDTVLPQVGLQAPP